MTSSGLVPTPSQTIGPFFRIGTIWLETPDLVPPDTAGAVVLTGVVFDGNGTGVPDAIVELWQEETGAFGRVLADEGGGFAFTLRRAGALNVTIFARGLLNRLVTRVRLSDDAEIDRDPILALAPSERRHTLVATAEGVDRYRWDVHLQGGSETVFLAW